MNSPIVIYGSHRHQLQAIDAMWMRRKGLSFQQIRTAMGLRSREHARQLVARGERIERQQPALKKQIEQGRQILREEAAYLQNVLSGKQSNRACRECGCTDNRACLHPQTGIPCHWVQRDLCSVCADRMAASEERYFAQISELDSYLVHPVR